MKILELIGGIIGFGIGILFGWAFESPYPSILWKSCMAAYVSGWLMKWWGGLWANSLKKALQDAEPEESQDNDETTNVFPETSSDPATQS